ncbi:hypothetical protein R1sor_003117 [Riccia sorocarpa]|uniref:Uncharacterized protein n=1 Tax=Riccia sorocarpa TaxID=122646 RepID=A0ABD3H0N3_9MARC
MVVVLEQAFAYVSHTVAPDPTNLWAESIRKPPYPTNSGWLNFVLGDGHLRVVPNLTVSRKQDSTTHRVTHYEDLSVTPEYGSHPTLASPSFEFVLMLHSCSKAAVRCFPPPMPFWNCDPTRKKPGINWS